MEVPENVAGADDQYGGINVFRKLIILTLLAVLASLATGCGSSSGTLTSAQEKAIHDKLSQPPNARRRHGGIRRGIDTNAPPKPAGTAATAPPSTGTTGP